MTDLDLRDGAPRRWAELVEAATDLFHQKGYNEASLADLARVMNMKKGSLYYYIASKQELLYEILASLHAGGIEELERVCGGAEDAVERLELYLRHYIRLHIAHRRQVTIYFRDGRHLSTAQLEGIKERRRAFDRYLRGILSEGQREGLFDRDLDIRLMALAMFGFMNNIYLWFEDDGPLTVDELAGEYTRISLRTLGARAPASHEVG
jgi:AcrR family transcriptional regulator